MNTDAEGLARLEEHRRVWQDKPVLRRIYAVWFDALLTAVAPSGRILEVGAGPGFLSAYARDRRQDLRWISTDIVETSWNEIVADGSRLPLLGGTCDAVVALDLIHHLAHPEAFFREAARALRGGGRIAAVEPWVTPLSYPIYRFLHEEGCDRHVSPWDPFGVAAGGSKRAFAGDSAIPTLLVEKTSDERWAELGFRAPRVRPLNAFAYLLSMGFQKRSLLPAGLLSPLLALDRATQAASAWLGLRALLIWERLGDGTGEAGSLPRSK